MQKDTVYIDVEDDITAIIGKVKAAQHSIVALVPPKRVGVLQSAVNMRLLLRTAKQADKKLVLITNNDALVALASAASIPVAKSLQSKPELVKPIDDTQDDDDDIIDGNKLPVGDHAKAASSVGEAAAIDKAIDDIEITDAGSGAKAVPVAPKKAKKSPKLPNFNNFRKRLVLIIIAAVLLIGFLIWAIFFAPHATITITAKTRTEQYNSQVKLSDQTSPSQATIATIKQTKDDKQTVDFEATGKKDVGEKATGEVKFTTDSYSALMRGVSIPAGTTLTSSSGKHYTTDNSVTLKIGNNTDTSTVTATDNGTSYNGAEGSVSGAPSGVDSASLIGPTSGGTDKTITVVSKSDIANAKKELADKDDDEAKTKLKEQFASSVVAIDESFTADNDNVSSSPAAGEEASSGKATLTSTVTYSMYGIDKNELDTYLNAAFNSLLDADSQRVYDTGSQSVEFSNFTPGKTPSVALQADGKIGPKIKEDQVKQESKGQVYGDIQSRLSQIDGVQNVDVKFFPFWVSSVPDNANKITVEFKLADD